MTKKTWFDHIVKKSSENVIPPVFWHLTPSLRFISTAQELLMAAQQAAFASASAHMQEDRKPLGASERGPGAVCRSNIVIFKGHSRNQNWRYLPYIRPIFQAYVRGYPQKIWPYMVQYLHFRILEWPLIYGCV